MKRKRTTTFIVSSCVLFSIALFMSACGSTKLIDIDKTSNFLNLSEEQLQVVQPKIEEIKTVVDEFNAEKETFETEMEELRGSRKGGGGFGGRGGFGGGRPDGGRGGSGGPRGGIREKLNELSKKQVSSQRQITTLVKEIKAVLDEEQLKKFEKIKLPELKMPAVGGGRRGGRMGGGRGGGRGGGGFPPF